MCFFCAFVSKSSFFWSGCARHFIRKQAEMFRFLEKKTRFEFGQNLNCFKL
jgi:hypothetical protein